MKLPDKLLIRAALNIYIRHLKGFDSRFLDDIKRCEELREKEIISNNLGITIKLDV